MKARAKLLRRTGLGTFTLGLAFVCVLGVSSPALATLGEVMPAAPAAAGTAVATQAKRQTVSRAALYSVFESELENGTVVKEFANATGMVFAVSWTGPMLPDLKGLLGSHFETFTAGANQARRPGSLGTPLNIAQDKVVIRSNGRMRHFFGHAYTPDQIPAGVDVNALFQ